MEERVRKEGAKQQLPWGIVYVFMFVGSVGASNWSAGHLDFSQLVRCRSAAAWGLRTLSSHPPVPACLLESVQQVVGQRQMGITK